MAEVEDKYADDEENLSQVRSIIKHLNEDKPSAVRSREVVVRADGTKVVRVTKKRKVMLTSADKRRKLRRHALLVASVCLLVSLVCGAFLFYRMATMSSSAYVEGKIAELQQTWGAENVQLGAAEINGTSFSLSSLVAEFPEDNMLQRVELSGVHAKLSLATFLHGRLTGDSLEVERAVLVLRNGEIMKMPTQNGADMWRFTRVDCKDFSVLYADDAQAPLALRNAGAYMYYPSRSRVSSAVMLRGGTLNIRGWRTVRITEGKVHVSAGGVEDFSFSGTTDIAGDETEQRRTSISFSGDILQGASMYGPFATGADNMSLGDFTDGRLESFFAGRTVAPSYGKLNGKFTMKLSADSAPRFSGELALKNISLRSFPALMSITEHIEHSKRGLYNPISISRGHVNLSHDGDSLVVELPYGAVVERDLASLRGRMVLNAANELSGEMDYGVPMMLARVEYPDGQPDPIFQPNGEWAVLRTCLSGNGSVPADDMAEVEARAEMARRNRPARIPFDQLDVNRLSEQMLNQPGASAGVLGEGSAYTSDPEPGQQESPQQDSRNPFMNPFESNDDPFAPSSDVPF